VAERPAHGVADRGGHRGQPGGGGGQQRADRGGAEAEGQDRGPRHGGEQRGGRPVRPERAGGDKRAGHRQPREEDRVQQAEEGEEDLGRRGSREARPAQHPEREGDPAGAARGQQPCGRRPAEREPVGRARIEDGRRPRPDEPQQRDIAREGERLGHDRGRDPLGLGGRRPRERVEELVAGAAEQRDGQRGAEKHRDERDAAGREDGPRASRPEGVQGGGDPVGGRRRVRRGAARPAR
jgi:hypothetical protein